MVLTEQILMGALMGLAGIVVAGILIYGLMKNI